MAMEWLRNKVADLRDTVADVKHDVTDSLVRCPSTSDEGKQCTLNKHTSGSHEDGEGGTW